MIFDVLTDITRFTHFVGFAIGIGAGCFADWSIIKKLGSEITTCDLNNLETVHKLVWAGLGLLWVSGLGLIYIRTGMELSNFTPKLVMKLFVVSLLTLNAVLLGRFAMPILARNVNKAYLSFSLEDKTILCVLGAVSICSWMCGLILGIFAALKMASFAFLFPLFIGLYSAALVGAVGFTIAMHIIWERRLAGAGEDALRSLDINNIISVPKSIVAVQPAKLAPAS
ncbi:MAG: hypothetical protein AAGF54_10615 [Pseudomonadota bacterium]